MLASQYKPHDPLAAEFIRTFRHQHVSGKYYLDRYDALYQKTDSTDIRILLPRHGFREDVADQVALYGFRNLHHNLFFLSPWEFCQCVVSSTPGGQDCLCGFFSGSQAQNNTDTHQVQFEIGRCPESLNRLQNLKIGSEIWVDV